jgi:hypothetical protein
VGAALLFVLFISPSDGYAGPAVNPRPKWDMMQIHPCPCGYEPPFSGKLCGVTRCEDLPNMTEQAHSAGNQPAHDEPAATPHTNGILPGDQPPADLPARPSEIGGRLGPEPTRYGDWELRGRCIDF